MVKTPSSNAGGAGSIPGWGAKIPRAVRCSQKLKKKKKKVQNLKSPNLIIKNHLNQGWVRLGIIYPEAKFLSMHGHVKLKNKFPALKHKDGTAIG